MRGYNKTTDTAIRGQWTPYGNKNKYRNALELKAAYLTLRSFCVNMTDTHVSLMLDNTTAVAYIREKGGGSKSKQCNEITCDIWHFAKQRNLWLSSAYIKGELNVIADKKDVNIKQNLNGN